MRNRIALVTGAAQGIGRAFAERLAEKGHKVYAADILDSGDTIAGIRAAGGTAESVQLDLTDEAAVNQSIAGIAAAGDRIDILVNNAAIHPNPFVNVVDLSYEAWKRMLTVNLDSVFLVTRAVLPAMIANGWGRVINLSSSSLSAPIPGGMSHYVTSKGGVVGFTRALASEVGEHGITVNAVAPHGVLSPGMRDLPGSEEHQKVVIAAQSIQRLLEPDDIAGAVGFLASDEAAMITAQVLHVDAGVVRAG